MKTVKANDEVSLKEYWQHQINTCDSSGLKKSSYCRKHNLNYDQMMYWQKKLKAVKPSSFIPAKIKLEQILLNDQCICTLTLPGGAILKIHDERALSLLLDKWK